jgi:hypothetical protein
MFVTNHALSGVLIGRALEKHPIAAFLAGVGSHLALDAMPHWGCDFHEPGGPERFLKIAKRDGIVGLGVMAAAAAAVPPRARVSTVAAMSGAALLDLDKPFKYFFGLHPFPKVVTRIHRGIQNESVDGMPNEFAYGATFAMADALVIALTRRRLRAALHQGDSDT